MNIWVAASPYTVVDSLLKEKTNKRLLLPKMIFLFFLLVVFQKGLWNGIVIWKGGRRATCFYFYFYFSSLQKKKNPTSMRFLFAQFAYSFVHFCSTYTLLTSKYSCFIFFYDSRLYLLCLGAFSIFFLSVKSLHELERPCEDLLHWSMTYFPF